MRESGHSLAISGFDIKTRGTGPVGNVGIDTWLLRNGTWQAVAYHASGIKPDESS